MQVAVTDFDFCNLDEELKVFSSAGVSCRAHQCRTPHDIIDSCATADALLVNRVRIDFDVLTELRNCKIIVRYGTGYENIDLEAAKRRGIPVCNVPDYATMEVADHTLSLALALARQLPGVDRDVRAGIWKIVPDNTMPSFRHMRFVTIGLGRIAREVLKRARSFGFELSSFDPFVPASDFDQIGVASVSLEQALQSADILSLHLPGGGNGSYLLDQRSFQKMKPTAILINTSRGCLVDTHALVGALQGGQIRAAGLDVFEEEPLVKGHPLLDCPNTILTSHMAWYSSNSVQSLQRAAAEETLRGLRGLPLLHRVA